MVGDPRYAVSILAKSDKQAPVAMDPNTDTDSSLTRLQSFKCELVVDVQEDTCFKSNLSS